MNQEVAIRLLEAWGHAVTTAESGPAALAALADRHVDLVLMDVQMPGMDGLDATAEIRRRQQGRGSRTPIVALTAHGTAADRERCLAAGMDDFVSKPLDARVLFQTIERFVRSPSAAPPSVTEISHTDPALERRLADLFAEHAPRLLAAVRNALDRGDATSAAVAAHTLKGAVGNLPGAHDLRRRRASRDARVRRQPRRGENGLCRDRTRDCRPPHETPCCGRLRAPRGLRTYLRDPSLELGKTILYTNRFRGTLNIPEGRVWYAARDIAEFTYYEGRGRHLLVSHPNPGTSGEASSRVPIWFERTGSAPARATAPVPTTTPACRRPTKPPSRHTSRIPKYDHFKAFAADRTSGSWGRSPAPAG